jgi:hypothetical protein
LHDHMAFWECSQEHDVPPVSAHTPILTLRLTSHEDPEASEKE